jgi:hypothetical protein
MSQAVLILESPKLLLIRDLQLGMLSHSVPGGSTMVLSPLVNGLYVQLIVGGPSREGEGLPDLHCLIGSAKTLQDLGCRIIILRIAWPKVMKGQYPHCDILRVVFAPLVSLTAQVKVKCDADRLPLWESEALKHPRG